MKAYSVTSRETLSKHDVHGEWASVYHTPDNEKFFELAFDYITSYLAPAPGETILDAGCGAGNHTIRLARRGWSVYGIDFSPAVLPEARERLAQFGDRVTLAQMDVTDLEFGHETFKYVLCWGVLMHVPLVEKAIAELARVTQRGGYVVVGENNFRSFESAFMRTLRRLLLRNRARRVPAGMETWVRSEAGDFIQRDADVSWLIETFRAHGLTLVDRRARQWTELYRFCPKPFRRAIHAFNNFWFRRIRWPQTAIGQLLIFHKE